MAHRMSKKWSAFLLGTGLLLSVLPGCGGTDLRGYRPASEHAESITDKPPESPKADAVVASSVNAEHQDSSVPRLESPANDFEMLPVSALVPVNVIDGSNVRALMSIPATDPKTASELVAAKPSVDGTPAVTVSEPRKIEVLIKEKTFRTDPKTGALRLTFDDLDLLKILNMDPVVENAVELMPDWLRGLEGKTIRLRGVMYPTFDAEGLENFVLARDSQTCCFGPGAKIYDLIQVSMKHGKTTNYIPYIRFFDVVGKLRIEVSGQDGKLFGLYSIDDAEIIER